MSYGRIGWNGTKARFSKSLEFDDKSLYCLGEFTTESCMVSRPMSISKLMKCAMGNEMGKLSS